MKGNLYSAFAERASRHPRATAIEWKKGERWVRISYGELNDRIQTLSAALSRYYGIKKGDKAAILIGNRPEWPIVFFALASLGAVSVPVNQYGVFREIGNSIADSGCRIAFTEGNISQVKIRTVRVDSPEFERLFGTHTTNAKNTFVKDDADACLLYTSGTTSSPKAVVLTHKNILSNIDSLYKLGLMKQGDGIVSVLPLHHNYALVVTTLGPLIYGGRVIYPGTVQSEKVIRAIKEAKGAIFVGVPLIFNAFHKTMKDAIREMPLPLRALLEKTVDILYAVRKKTGLNLARYLFYSVHRRFGSRMYVLLSGGSKLKKEVEIGMFKFGFTLLNGYGLTETSPVLTMNPLKNPKTGSVGRPIENVEIRIGKKDKKGFGEIIVRGPNVMKGYYKNEALTRIVMENGWFKTGDIGYMDGDGYLFLTGRVNDLIVLEHGLNVYPDEIESAYSSATPVKEICVFDAPSRKSAKDTSVLWAVVVPDMDFFKAENTGNPYEFIKDTLANISRNLSIPERLVEFSLTLDTLPRNFLGKINRREVKKLHAAGAIKDVFPRQKKAATGEDLEMMKKPEAEKVINCLKSKTRVDEITPQDSFELDLGIDILGRSELISELEDKIGVKMDEAAINNVFTVGELIEYVRQAKA